MNSARGAGLKNKLKKKSWNARRVSFQPDPNTTYNLEWIGFVLFPFFIFIFWELVL